MTADQIQAFASLITAVTWPVATAVAVWTFRDAIRGLLSRSKQLTVKFLGHEVTVQADRDGREIEELLLVVQDTVSGLSEEHRKLFTEINTADGGRKVSDYFKDFKRHTGPHFLLQELRDRMLIRPIEGGSWQAESHPVVTRFARLVLRLCLDHSNPGKAPNQTQLLTPGP